MTGVQTCALPIYTFPVRERGDAEVERNVRMIRRLNDIIDKLGMECLDEAVAQNDGLNCSDIILSVISGL